MDWILLVLIVLAATAIWPVGRWALKDNGEPGVVGFWVALTAAVGSAFAVAFSGEWRGAPAGVWVAAGLMSVAYAVGFWICIMRALQIGPAGPTVTINNMAMVAGVLYGLAMLTPGRATVWTWIGLAGVCAALVLLGLGKPAENGVHRSIGARWARLVAMGGAFSCLSFVIQAHVGTLYPAYKYVFSVAAYGLAALLLLPAMLRRPERFGLRHQRLGGIVLGAVNAATMPLTLLTIQRLGAEVVFPVAVATPILLMLIIGRVFYKERLSAAAWAACILGALAVAALADGSGSSRSASTRTDMRISTMSKNMQDNDGAKYRATVPDTLDLAEHGRLAINALTGHLEPEKHYAVYQAFTFDKDPQLGGLTWNLPAKDARVLPMLRAMTGSTQGLERERGLMDALLTQIGKDGLAYSPLSDGGAPQGTAYPYPNGLLALAMLSRHECDGDPVWLDRFRRLTTTLAKIAIRVEDRAYWPPESSYRPDGSWAWTTRGAAKIPYQPPEEPYLEQQGTEGCVKYEQAAPLRALVARYRLDGDAEALDVARRVVRFMLKPGMWEDTGDEGYAGNEHGVFAGHFHGNVTALHALLDMAVATDDAGLKQFVREGYEHARRTGIARMGWFPGWLRPTAHHRDAGLFLASETCGVADMLVLAVKLTDTGLGDYWDDVDAIVRNHLVAQQITDWDQMRALGGGTPEKDALLERLRGGFNQQMEGALDSTGPHLWGCCTANGGVGLYYAWHGITRFDASSKTATVNMLLNRASPWMDVESHQPYEGKVVLRNKQATSVLVRIPYWVAQEKVKCFVDDQEVRPAWAGNRLRFDGLRTEAGKRPGSVIRVEFPVPNATEKHTVQGTEYTLTFRGSTLVDIRPRDTTPGRYRYYLRDGMKRARAPMKTVEQFAAERIIPLQ
ncbi:MAG: DMT family transporter [bacterium]